MSTDSQSEVCKISINILHIDLIRDDVSGFGIVFTSVSSTVDSKREIQPIDSPSESVIRIGIDSNISAVVTSSSWRECRVVIRRQCLRTKIKSTVFFFGRKNQQNDIAIGLSTKKAGGSSRRIDTSFARNRPFISTKSNNRGMNISYVATESVNARSRRSNIISQNKHLDTKIGRQLILTTCLRDF